MNILIVDDESGLRTTLRLQLNKEGHTTSEACSAEEAIEKLNNGPLEFDLIFLDVNMSGMSGLEALPIIKSLTPQTHVVILTAFSTIQDAVQATKDGAFHYLSKPVKSELVKEIIKKIKRVDDMIHTLAYSSPIVTLQSNEFVGDSEKMQKVYSIIYKLSQVDTSVLIRGESGTGKELVARGVHYNSHRKNEPFIALNCSSIPETLFESELFGHEKGSFTGAHARQIGKFQQAQGGTIFLDELGDMPHHMQVKLLRVLQEKKFSPIGSSRTIELDIRIISATNQPLERMMEEGSFREDLFYRLNVVPIFLPPLRDRKEDILHLVSHFIQKYSNIHRNKITGLSENAKRILLNYEWPGNIRELENTIQHALVLETKKMITSESLPESISQFKLPTLEKLDLPQKKENQTRDEEEPFDFQHSKETFEKDFIINALKKFNGKINQTAIGANIPKKTLMRKIQKYEIIPSDYKKPSI